MLRIILKIGKLIDHAKKIIKKSSKRLSKKRVTTFSDFYLLNNDNPIFSPGGCIGSLGGAAIGVSQAELSSSSRGARALVVSGGGGLRSRVMWRALFGHARAPAGLLSQLCRKGQLNGVRDKMADHQSPMT